MKRIYILTVIALLACLLAGCHGGDTPSEGTPSDTTPQETLPATEPPAAPDTVPGTEPVTEGDAEPETFPEVALPFTPLSKDLPIVSVNTNGVVVESKDYVDMTLTLANVEEPLVEVGGAIRMRGNSTAKFPKKPYRIKLDQKHSFFGLDKAKSWVLLAD